MSIKQLYKIVYLLFVAISLQMVACTRDPDEGGIITPGDDKVRVELYAKIDEYGPATRTGSASENTVNQDLWVLVFAESGSSPGTYLFAEAAKAQASGAQSTVMLAARTVPCKLLLLANMASLSGGAEYFSVRNGNAYTTYDFTAKNLKTVLAGKTPEEASLTLLSAPLPIPQTTAPFASEDVNRPVLPMSYLHSVSSISSSTQIGSSTNKLLLTRSVAKVVVQNTDQNVTLIGATMINVPVAGRLHRIDGQSLLDNSGTDMLTYYRSMDETLVESIAAANPATINSQPGQTTADNPLYVFESGVADKTGVIIKANYQGNDYYYKLSFANTSGNRIDVLRNYEYTFTVTEVKRPGYGDFFDAMHSSIESQDALSYSILISDSESHEVIYNGEYYLGFSNSSFRAYGNTPLNRTIAFMITTNCSTPGPSTNYIRAVSNSAGNANDLQVNQSAIILASAGAPTTTTVTVNMANAFTSGTITVALGNLIKTIDIERKPIMTAAGGIISFPDAADFNDMGNYQSAYVADPTAVDWITFSYDGMPNNTVGPSIVTTEGKLYMHVSANGSTGSRSNGVIYISRANDVRRLRLWVSQLQ